MHVVVGGWHGVWVHVVILGRDIVAWMGIISRHGLLEGCSRGCAVMKGWVSSVVAMVGVWRRYSLS